MPVKFSQERYDQLEREQVKLMKKYNRTEAKEKKLLQHEEEVDGMPDGEDKEILEKEINAELCKLADRYTEIDDSMNRIKAEMRELLECLKRKPVIGIVGKHNAPEKNTHDAYIKDAMKQAIFDNGGIAIGIISPNDEVLYAQDDWNEFDNVLSKEDIIAQIKLCDGILLQGGARSEAYEAFIAKYCYDNDIPCLGICAGQNAIARGLGGTTFLIPNPEKHFRKDLEYVHSITIDKTSLFYSIVKKETMMVNSRHKNMVKDTPLLDKAAFCEDGYPDVIESKNKKFYIGVRFHPELLYKKDENMKAIFLFFIDSCRL